MMNRPYREFSEIASKAPQRFGLSSPWCKNYDSFAQFATTDHTHAQVTRLAPRDKPSLLAQVESGPGSSGLLICPGRAFELVGNVSLGVEVRIDALDGFINFGGGFEADGHSVHLAKLHDELD